MATPNNTLPSPDISDVMSLLSMMKKQNEDILAKNEEILTKLNAIEEDNQKLRQELHEIKSSLKHQNHNIKVSSRKRDDPDEEEEDQKEPSNSNKKARVSVASLPNPEPVQAFDPPASFNTLDDDCLGNVLDFVGKSCYSAFGRVNKRCHEMFCLKGLPKKTYLYGYGPLNLIQHRIEQRRRGWCSGFVNGVLYYNRRDIFEWILTAESYSGYSGLKHLCYDAIKKSRLDILREVFQRANTQQLEHLRDCNTGIDLFVRAAHYGKLECMKLLRENECEWDDWAWYYAKLCGHEHILQYLRNNGYPSEWQK